ncbi:DUF5928 domain-containing protein [Sulfitobacter sp. D35]|uniref:DUF5928 domain-containing protein n=1 Tax=Sulfitobacter sp. D35 TaxID=3083252 RepID=UPI00296E7783|nr:DUF5928 domain-containing protein [Sulfitobacter sp. D35]MDW4500177.1 DUF5928 domain-containing protein [Sulfitobacter sp. D35]
MAKLAYILLCHKDPATVVDHARRLTATGDVMAIHFDRRASAADFKRIRSELADNPSVRLVEPRLRCGWGEWSLVKATISALRTARAAFPDATHLYLLSGDCMAIKSAEYIHAFLDARDADFIESFDFFDSDWIKTGMREDRLIYRHVFNERRRKRLFYAAYEAQKRLGLRRKIPAGLRIQIGSQWWCLRRETVDKVLDFADSRPDVMRFFRTTWIPDETFFQTLVRHLVPTPEIETRTPTFLLFSDYGMPVTFYNDHYDLLLAQDYLFARKISPEATDLQRKLGALYAAKGIRFQISNEGRSLFEFVTKRGRIGRRFAERVWEKDSTVGRDRELLIVLCKKWHVAKRVLDRIRQVTNVPALEYIFDEDEAGLPDLGGIEASLAKRTRHRRALMRMLFDFFGTDRMIVCVDPGRLDLVADFARDRCTTRLLEIECHFSDSYLAGHAVRVGLAGAQTAPSTLARVLPTIRNDILHEADRLRDAGFHNHLRMRERAGVDENAHALAEFLALGADGAREIASTEYLFAD